MKTILSFAFLFLSFGMLFSQTARLQVIHNSPTPNVDVYVNGNILLNDFVFRTATPFIDVPAGVELIVGIAGADSNSADDAIANFTYTLADGGSYVLVASGIVGGDPGFDLKVFDMATESVAAGNVGILFFHGSPDAPDVDILAGGAPLIDNVPYGSFAGYLEVPASTYELSVTPANDNSTIVATYNADFSFWSGNTAVIFASGFLSGDAPSFEPWVALSTGGTYPLAAATTGGGDDMARLQVIHNSPTPNVDVYVNGALLLDNFVFRTATPFIDVPAGVDLNVGIAPASSTSSDESIANFTYNLEAGGSYVLVANGIVGGDPGFNIEVFGMGMEEVGTDNVGLLFFHGSPDAPEVDIVAGGNPIFDDVAFGEFSGYLEVPATSYTLDVTPAADNNTIVATYAGDFSFWKGKTAVVFASGFLGGENPGFEPWVALSNGGTFPLANVPGKPALQALIQTDLNNSTALNEMDLNIFPNPAINEVQLQWSQEMDEEIEVMIFNQLGQSLKVISNENGFNGLNNLAINLSDFEAGLYFIKLVSETNEVTKRLLVTK